MVPQGLRARRAVTEVLYTYKVVDVLDVVDGDTVDVRFSMGFGGRFAFRFRLAHVDAPEMRGARATPEGALARDFTAEWLDRHRAGLLVTTYKSSDRTVGIGDGAFGRWLGDFHRDGTYLADALVDAGLAQWSAPR